MRQLLGCRPSESGVAPDLYLDQTSSMKDGFGDFMHSRGIKRQMDNEESGNLPGADVSVTDIFTSAQSQSCQVQYQPIEMLSSCEVGFRCRCSRVEPRFPLGYPRSIDPFVRTAQSCQNQSQSRSRTTISRVVDLKKLPKTSNLKSMTKPNDFSKLI
jgi:hypothetical protein